MNRKCVRLCVRSRFDNGTCHDRRRDIAAVTGNWDELSVTHTHTCTHAKHTAQPVELVSYADCVLSSAVRQATR